MKDEFKFIVFQKTHQLAKTSIYSCRNKKSGDELGIVKWYPAWRQYCYFPTQPAVYSVGCLKDINTFIEQLS